MRKRISYQFRSLIPLVSLAAACMLATGAGARSFPSKPIRMIVPNAPGGATDVAARLVGPKLAEQLGQPVVVENRAGAAAVTGTNYAAQAAPDGHTLVMVFDSFTMNPYLFKNVQYDPIRDFAPITLVVRNPQLLVAHPSTGAKTLQEFLQRVRSKGAGFNFATAGAGTSSGLWLELFKAMAGVEPTAIHYRGGAPAITDLLGGQVSATIITAGVVIQHVRAGKLIPIAITSARRHPGLPDVQTMAEDLPGFEAQSWIGLLAPAGTPRPTIDRLHAATEKALAAPEVREKFESQMAEVVAGPPGEFAAWIKAESTRWGTLIRARNIRLD